MGRNLLTLLVALCGIFLHTPVSAATSEFQLTPRVGYGALKIHEFANVDGFEADTRTFGIGAGAGYLTPIGVVLEVGYDSFGNFDLFQTGSFSLSQEFASIGYQFDLGHQWRLVPRVGRAHWELRSKEGRLFNPGPEDVRYVKGNDYFWEVGVARQISRVVTLGVTFKQGQYDFGRTQSGAFTVTLGF